MVKRGLLFVIILFFIAITSAQITVVYDDDAVPRVMIEDEVPTTTINNFTINGTEVVHNNMTGLQGGDGSDQFYHLTLAIYNTIVANVNDWITSKWLTTASRFLFNDSTQLYFNDTLLNETIGDYTSNLTGGVGGGTGIWTNDTDPGLAEFDGNISIKNEIQFTDSNITIVVNETEIAFYI